MGITTFFSAFPRGACSPAGTPCVRMQTLFLCVSSKARGIPSTPPLPWPFLPAIRRLPPCTTRGIGVKGLDMVRWPAPPPGDLSPLFLLCLRVGGDLSPDLSCKQVRDLPIFRWAERRSAHPLLRALSPLSCGTRDGAPAAGLQLPLATPGGSWRPAQGAEEAGAGPWPPLPLPRWRS